jgi:hypothetical protein
MSERKSIIDRTPTPGDGDKSLGATIAALERAA